MDWRRHGSGLEHGARTCAAYCDAIGQVCTNTCTTNGNLVGWGMEAWDNGSECANYVPSTGQGFCAEDLSMFSNPDVAKYRCCCH